MNKDKYYRMYENYLQGIEVFREVYNDLPASRLVSIEQQMLYVLQEYESYGPVNREPFIKAVTELAAMVKGALLARADEAVIDSEIAAAELYGDEHAD